MKEGFRLVVDGYARMGRIIRQKYLLPFVGVMLCLLIATTVNLTDWTVFRFWGVTPTRAMLINGRAGWWTTGEVPQLVIIAERTRWIACPGGLLKRELIYRDRANIPAPAQDATTPTSLTASPMVRATSDSPTSTTFSLNIPVKNPKGLWYIRWQLFASPGQCEDGEGRDGQEVGLIEVPPYPDDVTK